MRSPLLYLASVLLLAGPFLQARWGVHRDLARRYASSGNAAKRGRHRVRAWAYLALSIILPLLGLALLWCGPLYTP